MILSARQTVHQKTGKYFKHCVSLFLRCYSCKSDLIIFSGFTKKEKKILCGRPNSLMPKLILNEVFKASF